MEDLPLFPLSSIVMPGGVLPLRIFEPRYLDMVRDCLKNQSGFGVCLANDSGVPVHETLTPYPCGTIVDITDWDRDESGLLMIVTRGYRRFRLQSVYQEASGLLLGNVQLLQPDQSTPLPVEYSMLAEMLHRVLDSVGCLVEYKETNFRDAVWVGSRLIELLPMPSSKRHDLICMDDPVNRLRELQRYIDEHPEW